ncbi:hypothetical protein EVAR_66906_1 [Eumeta japonica]|uniref:Uncharacterized protein n=1 Tax=Eumeta variegata TaxID=151549 RepID=A0A4C1Z5K8_EUMVA|nr:hypothetical protein EVAR_66906_1 [Eumeta japonica]
MPSIRYLLLFKTSQYTLLTSPELRVFIGGYDHIFSGGLHALLTPENTINKPNYGYSQTLSTVTVSSSTSQETPLSCYNQVDNSIKECYSYMTHYLTTPTFQLKSNRN